MGNIKHATKDTFNADISQKDKPTLVYFWAEWCNPCKTMSPLFEEYAKSENAINLVKVDVDAAQEISQQYNVMSIPTFLLFKDGKVTGQNVGSMTLDQLQTFAKQ